MKLNRKNIYTLVLLVAIINCILAISLFIRDIASEFYISSFIVILALQIIVIVISIINLKSKETTKSKILMLFSISILVVTFFIPIQMNLDFAPSSPSGLSPAVMPEECKQNIYKIIIYSDN